MIEDNWELVTGNAAHQIEVLNYSNQINVIEALVHLLMDRHRGPDGSCSVYPSEVILREFHRTATLFLLKEPGQYRTVAVHVGANGKVVHQPPEAKACPEHIQRFFDRLGAIWSTSSAQELAAFTLWAINWIHPFRNGNGRTARAFAYACICLKIGAILGGRMTVIDLIMENREEYYNCLAIADAGLEKNGRPELGPMTRYIDRLLAQQLSSF